jgi:hypothetical protein
MRAGHFSDAELALASTGDLGWRRRFAIWRHARQCRECASAIEGYRGVRSELKRDAAAMEMDEAAWLDLEGELKANIRLGFTAGQIVDTRPGLSEVTGAEAAGWRAAVVLATLTVVMAGGWLLKRPVPGVPDAAWQSVVAEANSEGVGIHEGQAGMTLLGPERESSVMLAGTAGGARARFIDAETGQVTIHHVALEE